MFIASNRNLRMPEHPLIHDRSATASGTTARSADPILRAQGLHRVFKMGDSLVEVLKGVDLTIRTGEFIAIEGRSGSGKSTLLHIMGALDEPNGGTVEFKGQDFVALSSAERSHLRNTQFGFLFQFLHLLPGLNVLE